MSRRISSLACLFLFAFAPAFAAAADDLPSPEQFFGHVMGAEGKLIDYPRSLEYYRLLAERSDRMLYQELGKTTNGNPFVLLIISSPENLAKLGDLRAARDRLCDPRKLSEEEALRLAEELPAVAYHTGNIHTSEISCAHVTPELVYDLVSGNSAEVRKILDNVITLVGPNANPDGLVMIKEWFDANEGQPWEGNMPWLYHPYVGHDDNRDWMLLHFPAQRLTATKIFNVWHPIYSIEMHQMGSYGARIFVPPYKDPLDPNTAPQVVDTMNIIGTAMSHRLTTEGKGGAVKAAIFDLYTPARAYNCNHGIGRILTETASCNFVRTLEIKPEEMAGMRRGFGEFNALKSSWNFPLPWEGGAWSLREMVEYQLSTNMAALDQVASQPGLFNKAQYMALKRACDGVGGSWPYAYVVPSVQSDPGNAAEMLRALQRGEVEIHRATAPFTAGGNEFPAGSHIVILRQPYAAWVKSLLENQEYPDLRKRPNDPPDMPYDVTGHSLPLLMNVEAVCVEKEFEAYMIPVTGEIAAPGEIAGRGDGFVIDCATNDAYTVADELLDAGFAVSRLTKTLVHDDDEFAAGSFVVKNAKGLEAKLAELAPKRNFKARGIGRMPQVSMLAGLSNPRIALYIPWGGNMDAGWIRLVLELYGFEYEIIRNADFRAGNLSGRFDIIIFADGMSEASIKLGRSEWPEEYTGGLGDEGVAALRAFVEEGGTALASGSTSMALVELLGLPIVDKLKDLKQQEHFSPGSIVAVDLDPASPLAAGLPAKLPVMKIWGPAFSPDITATDWSGLKMAASFARNDVRLSGFLLGPEHLHGAGAIAVQEIGKGRAILFACRTQFRAMTYGSYKLLFNSIFWAAAD